MYYLSQILLKIERNNHAIDCIAKCSIALLICSMLTSCGLKPAYISSAINAQLMCVEVTSGTSVYEIEALETLKSLLPVGLCDKNNKQHSVSITLSFNQRPFIISSKADVLRQTLTVNASYSLIHDSQVVHSAQFNLTDSYNSFETPYIAHAEEETLKHNLAKMAAESVHRKLMMFFANRSS